MAKKMWGGRFSEGATYTGLDFSASIPFDQRMYAQDIEGSVAHAIMLCSIGVLTEEEKEKIIDGLQAIKQEIDDGKFEFKLELEDIHTNVEAALIEKIGSIGAKLHTARSRNDQSATDTHLYVRLELLKIMDLVRKLQAVLIKLSEDNLDVYIPGYTHMQRAQPILFSQHIMAYFYRLEDDWARLRDTYKRVNRSPLGACALAGTTFPINRAMTAELLGFDGYYSNSMDAVTDRDYTLEFLADCAILAMHISRMNEDLILWCTNEFGIIEMSENYSTGSSIMPQKKNPDVAELSRGKSGRVFGNLIGTLTVMKGLPYTFNSDMQEDKEQLFDTIDTIKALLTINAGMFSEIKVKKERTEKMIYQDYSNATDLADYLVGKGIPFREAHYIVGKVVVDAIAGGVYLLDLKLSEYRTYSELIEDDIYQAINPVACVNRRISPGGTAPVEVKKQIAEARQLLTVKFAI